MWSGNIFSKNGAKILPSENCQKFGSFLTILTKKFFFCKSIPNGLKCVKNTKSATPNFCRSPVPATGGRPIFPLENVNTSYHSDFQQIQSINVVGEHVFKKRCQNFTFQKLPKIWLSFLTILTKNFFLQIDSKWSEMRKKHKIGDAEFLPVAGAGNRRSTDFPSREC